MPKRIFRDEESLTPDALAADRQVRYEITETGYNRVVPPVSGGSDYYPLSGASPIPPDVLAYTSIISRFYGSVI